VPEQVTGEESAGSPQIGDTGTIAPTDENPGSSGTICMKLVWRIAASSTRVRCQPTNPSQRAPTLSRDDLTAHRDTQSSASTSACSSPPALPRDPAGDAPPPSHARPADQDQEQADALNA